MGNMLNTPTSLQGNVCQENTFVSTAEIKPLDCDTRAELGEGREQRLLNREPGFLAVT
jgi:hypothetical protein